MLELINTLRVLLNDLDSPHKYADDRLQKSLVVAARMVVQEFKDFSSYVITTTITPDPQSDSAFFNLVALKAACMMDQANARASGGITQLKQGNNEIRTDTSLSGKLWEGKFSNCAAYEQAKLEYKAGGISNAGAILIGPKQYFGRLHGSRYCQ